MLPAVTAARRSESELEEPRPRNIGLVPVAECAAGCAHGPRLSVTSKFGDQLRGLSRCPLASRCLLSLSPPLRRIVSPSRSTAGRDHSDKFDCQWTAHDSDLSNSGPPGARLCPLSRVSESLPAPQWAWDRRQPALWVLASRWAEEAQPIADTGNRSLTEGFAEGDVVFPGPVP